MVRRLKIYFIHSTSTKIDYQTILYRPIISSPICLRHELMLPLSKGYQERYVKELLEEADLIIAEVSDPNFTLKLELKWALAVNKPIKYISLNNIISPKLVKLVPTIEQITTTRPLIKIVEDFISHYADMTVAQAKDTTIVLGTIDEIIPENAQE